MRISAWTGWMAAWLALSFIPLAAWADPPAAQGIRRLPDEIRAKVLAALAGLIILGFGMVALIWLGARVTHRYRHGKAYFRPTPRPGEHDWAGKPLAGDSGADSDEAP